MLWTALVGCGDSGSDVSGDAGREDAQVQADASVAATWATLAPMPEAVQETSVVELGGLIYVLGGIDASGTTLSRVRTYDVLANTWATAAAMPVAVHHVNAAVVQDKIYVVGSLLANFSVHAGVWEYDPALDEWTVLADMPAGSERGASAVAVVDEVIYVAGGLRGLASVDELSSFTPATKAWDTALPAMPQPLNHLAGEAVGGVFYVLGGREVGIGGIVGAVHAFDPSMASWSSRTTMPTARGGMAAGVVDQRIVLVGGEGNAGESSGVFREVEVYDPALDQWTELEAMPSPRHGMGAVGYQGALYVPGGATVQGFGATDVHERLRF